MAILQCPEKFIKLSDNWARIINMCCEAFACISAVVREHPGSDPGWRSQSSSQWDANRLQRSSHNKLKLHNGMKSECDF